MLRLLRACGVPWPLPSLPWCHPVFAGSWNDPPRRIFCAKTARFGGRYPHVSSAPAFPFSCEPSRLTIPTFGRRADDRRLPLMWPENRAYFGGHRLLRPKLNRRRAAETLPIRRRQPKQSVAAKHTDAIPTGARRRHPIPRRSGRIPAMVCVVNACASVRLCRSLPSFAFHLASPVICRERASRRERDGPMPFHPGAARATVRACRVRKPIHPTLAHSDGDRASSCAHTRLALRAASAGRFG